LPRTWCAAPRALPRVGMRVGEGQKSEGSNGNSGLLMTWASPPASWYFVGEDQGITASGETDMKVSWHGLHI